MTALTPQEIQKHLESLPNWEYQDGMIHTAFEFATFTDAFAMMTRIAFEVERLNHHPNWYNVYNRLEISLSTHDAGGVTALDFQLAAVIDGLIDPA